MLLYANRLYINSMRTTFRAAFRELNREKTLDKRCGGLIKRTT